MDIRRATDDDAPAIHSLLQRCFAAFRPQYTARSFDATVLDPERVRGRLAEGPVWIAVAAGGIVGTVSARLSPDEREGIYVRGMGVDPATRGQGVGAHLLATAERWARAEGAKRMWLSTTLFLVASQRLYERAGFVETEGPPDLHGTPLRSYEKLL